MNKKFTVYEAGKMSGLTLEQMNNWRIEATELLNLYSNNRIHTINPVDYYNFEMDRNTYTDKEVMEFDLQMVKHSNLILVNLEYPDTIGTAIELFASARIWDIPVIGFGIDKIDPHPWMKLCLTKTCKTLEEVVIYIVEYYLPNF